MTDANHAYLIWSLEHAAWWAKGEYGYTLNVREAGLYDEAAAKRIVEQANIDGLNEIALDAEPLLALTAASEV